MSYLLSYFPPQLSFNRLRMLHTKSLPTTALIIYISYFPQSLVLVIYVRYLLSHFPPHPRLNRLRTLLTKLLLKTLGIYVIYLLVYFPGQLSLSHRSKLLVYFPLQPSLSHLSTLLTKFRLTTTLMFCLNYLLVYLPP